MQINDKFRIVKSDDGINLELQEYREVISKITKEVYKDWKWLGYYGNLESACKDYIKKVGLDACDYNTPQEVINAIEKAKNDIVEVIRKTGLTVKDIESVKSNKKNKDRG